MMERTSRAERGSLSSYRIMSVYVFIRLSSRESHLVSLYNAVIETSLVAPVAILAASI